MSVRAVYTTFFLLFSGIAFAQSGEGAHTIAQELVGKWCYISRNASTLENLTASCITLNNDGTYEIQLDPTMLEGGTILAEGLTSDAGTWWVQGNVLYYNSNSQGKGTFRFQKANHPRIEKTPVLIVNGVVFCSPDPRDPW